MTTYSTPEIVYGVDFSAAKRDAGRKTWIAKGRAREEGLDVERLADAATFLDCDADRQSTLDALASRIRDSSGESVAFGLDFPFGLPASLLDGDDDWHAFVDGVPDEWGALGSVDSPKALYQSTRTFSEEHDVRLLRETDEVNGGQEPTGFRIKTQTYYGISGLLTEIHDDVSIPPMDDPDGRPLVLETYPACTFESVDDAVRTGYKRDTRDAIDTRRSNVDALVGEGVDFDGHEEYAVASDHALDAVAAAYATFGATRDSNTLDVCRDGVDREGYIYGGATESA